MVRGCTLDDCFSCWDLSFIEFNGYRSILTLLGWHYKCLLAKKGGLIHPSGLPRGLDGPADPCRASQNQKVLERTSKVIWWLCPPLWPFRLSFKPPPGQRVARAVRCPVGVCRLSQAPLGGTVKSAPRARKTQLLIECTSYH